MKISQIRTTILLTIILATAPAIGLIVYVGVELQDVTREQLLREAHRHLDALEEQQRLLGESTREVLRTIAAVPAIRAGNREEIDPFLRTLVSETSYFVTFLVADVGATVIATGAGVDGHSLRDRPYVFEYELERNYYAGNLVIGRATGNQVVPFVYPYYDLENRYAGFVLASLHATRYFQLLTPPDLPPGSEVTFTDSRGVIMYHSTRTGELWRALSPEIWTEIQNRPDGGYFTVPHDDDNGEKLLVYSGIRLRPELDPYVWITVTIPYRTFFEPVRRLVAQNSRAAAGSLVAALVIGYLVVTISIVRRIGTLVEATESVAHGTIDPVLPRIGGHDEITDLARAFDRMTEQIQARENDLRQTVEERELLLRELHHRVKNNFQVLASLLNLQMDGHSDPAVLTPLQEGRNRILSMALIHERFSGSREPARIDFAAYLDDLIRELQSTYDGQNVEIHLEAEDITLNIEEATPLGLIVNETVSNAFKHAFKDDRKGVLTVELTTCETCVRLAVTDNGRGLPADLDPERSESLGFLLISILTRQINGTWCAETVQSQGTRISVEIPRK